MSAVFLKILNMSITASWLILAVILARVLLKKTAKWIPCLLWALVAVRLICPFSFESVLSLVPSSETIPENIALQHTPAINSGITFVNDAVNPVIAESFSPVQTNSVNPLQIVIPAAAAVWIAGIAVMLAYALISYLKLRKTVSACVPVEEGILACDEVRSPFILGVFRPIIYVPSSMSGETLEYVIRHEKAHLQRHDHWWKPLGFLLLSVYWFNPLCWIAYILLCRDIEMACDEKVIHSMDKDGIAAYSQALLDCSYPRRSIAACPLAFGEAGVKERVKGVLNYKKPAFWIILAAAAACVVLAVCLMTDPFSERSLSEKLNASMDQAVIERKRSSLSEDHFITADYDVLLVSESENKTTVYAWVLCEEYSFDGRDVKEESGFHIPTAVTFDTSDDDSEVYDVIEYWQPRDGSYYAEDIKAKFPWPIRRKALDSSGSKVDFEKCRQAALDYYGVKNASDPQRDERPVLYMNGRKYIDPYKPESSLPYGYQSAGSLSAEQAGSTGLEGTQFFTDPDHPDDFYTYQLCGTPTGLDEVDSGNRNWLYLRWISEDLDPLKERRLTLDDVRFLCRRGKTLSWDDFDAYQGEEIGSGLYIMQYVIDDLFDVIIGGTDTQTEPAYIYLRYRNSDSRTDIRTDDVDAFINAYKSGGDIESMRNKYPEYFDLDTNKGLEVYVWQMTPGSYSCGVMSGTDREKTDAELMNLKGASVAETRVILSAYDIDESDIRIIPWQNPISSYISDYWISLNGEDPAAAEKRRQEYIERVRGMLLDDAQPDISTHTVYANWSEDGLIFRECLNGSTMIISSSRHLPVYKFDSAQDLDDFKEKFRDILTFDHGYNEVPSFNEITAGYDDSFFEEYSVILAYMTSGSGSYRYAVQRIEINGSDFCVYVSQTNDPEAVTADMAGWLLITEVRKEDIKECTDFDAVFAGVQERIEFAKLPGHILYGEFSYEEETRLIDPDSPVIKTSGFANTAAEENFDPVERAKAEVNVDYDLIQTFYDESADIWKVHFFHSMQAGGDETVYLDGNGITQLITYGE